LEVLDSIEVVLSSIGLSHMEIFGSIDDSEVFGIIESNDVVLGSIDSTIE
jgi:hypothetical protein